MNAIINHQNDSIVIVMNHPDKTTWTKRNEMINKMIHSTRIENKRLGNKLHYSIVNLTIIKLEFYQHRYNFSINIENKQIASPEVKNGSIDKSEARNQSQGKSYSKSKLSAKEYKDHLREN